MTKYFTINKDIIPFHYSIDCMTQYSTILILLLNDYIYIFASVCGEWFDIWTLDLCANRTGS